jgi:competence protein ComFC
MNIGLCSSCITGIEPIMYSRHIATPEVTYYKSTVLFKYDKTTKSLVSLFKFRKELAQAKTITALMLESLNLNSTPDLIVPVPSHIIDEIKRGFSHMAYIASIISQRTEIPFDMVLAKKLFPLFKRTQKHKGKKQRIKDNNRFYLRNDSSVKGKNVLLIDDVITTGNTIQECAKILLKNGAKNVEAVCFALTPM